MIAAHINMHIRLGKPNASGLRYLLNVRNICPKVVLGLSLGETCSTYDPAGIYWRASIGRGSPLDPVWL